MPSTPLTIDELETPALTVDMDIVEANASRMASYAQAHGLRVRPHTKTHKIPALAKLQLASGCTGITVAKAGEAEVMHGAGLHDILVAYPIVGDSKLERLAHLSREARIAIAVDSDSALDAMAAAAQAAGTVLSILVEIDVGMRRCGVGSSAEAVRLAQRIDSTAGIRFAGIQLYPGHIWAPPGEQSEPLRRVSEQLGETLDALAQHGLHAETVSGGSTPTAMQSHLVAGLTEIRPGTYLFNDRNTIGVGACTLADCALRVIATVVSVAVPGRAIVDAGSKTFSSDRWISGDGGFGLIAERPELLIESMSEEHGHLKLSAEDEPLRIGERLSIVPNHVCACVNLHNRIWYHRKGIIEGFWTVEGRGRVA
ncbi:MAG TPA: D-TA family PLP-dependent enzyme [Terracidiphilus sp.]|nr:D-TA family PLP-dependent enzyme [Terracidiphilus sp.]